MATELGVAYLSIAASTGALSKDLKKTLGGFQASADQAGKKSGGMLGGGLKKGIGLGVKALAGLTLGVAALAAKGGIDRALAIEGAEKKLEGLGHSTATIEKIMGNALASVRGTAYGLGDAASVAAGLVASGVKAGGQLEGVLKTVADTAAISGRSMTDIGAIFGSVAARGKLQGDDMLQLMSSGVPVLQMVADQLGVTSAEASKLVSQGKVDFATFAAAMEAGMGGAALKSGETFKGALSNVYAALGRFGAVAATPALGILKQGFNAAIPAIDALTAKIKPFMDEVGPRLSAAVGTGLAALSGLGGKAQGFLAPLVDGFKSLTSGLDFDALVTAGGQIMSAISPVGLVFKSLAPLLPQLGQAFASLATQGLAILVPLLTELGPMFAEVGATLVTAGTQIASALLPVLMQLASSILPVIGQVIAAVVPVIGELVAALLPIVPIVADLVTQLLPPLAAAVQALIPAIMPLISAVLSVVKALMPLIGVVIQLVSSLIPPLMAVIQALLPPIVEVATVIAGALAPILSAVGDLITALMPVVAGLVGVIASIVGAVAPVVAVIAGKLIGVLGALIGIVGTVLAAVVRFVVGAVRKVGEFASNFGTKIGEVVKFFSDLPGKIMGALSGMASRLLQVGRDMIQGLINGIKQMADNVVSAARGVVDGAVNAAKSLLGISSPSKVFRGIGQQVSNGLALGITDTAAKASSAISKVISLVTAAANTATGKAAKKRAKAQAAAVKKILTAQQKVTAKFWRDDETSAATTDRMLRALTSAGKWTSKASAALKKSTFADLATARGVMAERIKDANAVLADLLKESDSLRDQIASSITGELDLVAAMGTTRAAITNAQGKVVGWTTTSGFSGIAAHVKGLAAKAKAFAGKLQDLIKAGFPAGLVQEVAGLGTTDGISVANSLLSATSAERTSLISDYSALTSWSSQAGSYVADQMYGVGIAAQEGIIAGLMADDAKIAKAAENLATKLTKAVKKKLGIKSPSTVFRDEVGLMAAKGAAQGLDAGRRIVAASARSLIDPVLLSGDVSVAGGRGLAGAQITVNEVAGDPIATAVATARHIAMLRT